jgi:hypothetical protein
MKDAGEESSIVWRARVAGLCYLITIGVGAFDHLFVGGKLISPGDAAATARNILASEGLYRLAFALDLIPVYLVVTVIFYEMFQPVNRTLSLLAAVMSLAGGACGAAVSVFQFAPLVVLRGNPFPIVFDVAQREALSLLCLRLHEVGFTISLVFFGSYCVVLGCLIWRSIFIPRAVGALLAAGGLAYSVYSLAWFVSPSMAVRLGPSALTIGSLGEIALTIWLLAFGVNVSRWRGLRDSQRNGDN